MLAQPIDVAAKTTEKKEKLFGWRGVGIDLCVSQEGQGRDWVGNGRINIVIPPKSPSSLFFF